MQKGTRSLIRVNIIDAQLAEKRVSVLMGDDVSPRKEWSRNAWILLRRYLSNIGGKNRKKEEDIKK